MYPSDLNELEHELIKSDLLINEIDSFHAGYLNDYREYQVRPIAPVTISPSNFGCSILTPFVNRDL